ncbi:hypothetical protein A5746_13015 [Mycolicibacterium conceptionense]|uniref:hypothetical protein n=1 Tax=Mycolicibacterium conceptionense TaxID=451644 RepID=UPI0007ED37A5|nr:hypothetical protein [Mycolicibacterium conceptionense]OBJ98303.1 hypothetical protein A5639_29435 [Mycolicibacterium conceptionense]OMB72706.1 hypothetical protein A5741_05680 [Mycolicibacterium conceptionense]OMB99998.1 hypothetical protein A5746_13015 [Mycolicibacterium conceptionense]
MDAPVAAARWALDLLDSMDAAQPRWDECAVTAAVRRYLAGIGVPEPDWIAVAASPDDAYALRRPATTDSNVDFMERTKVWFRAEGEVLSATAWQAFLDQFDVVVDKPLFNALAATERAWEHRDLFQDLLPAYIDVAEAIGARAADMSPELLWAWDQIVIAFENGLGWYSFVDDGGLILLPQPAMTLPQDRLHNVDGPAVVWPDGSSSYFLDGIWVDSDLHHRVVHRTVTAENAVALSDPDQELLAISAAPAEEVLTLLNAVHVDTGVKGTRLYRVNEHFAPGRVDYCITMTDPSTGRSYLEWVDPDIADLGDAELCQAHLFGIDLRDWLALKREA